VIASTPSGALHCWQVGPRSIRRIDRLTPPPSCARRAAARGPHGRRPRRVARRAGPRRPATAVGWPGTPRPRGGRRRRRDPRRPCSLTAIASIAAWLTARACPPPGPGHARTPPSRTGTCVASSHGRASAAPPVRARRRVPRAVEVPAAEGDHPLAPLCAQAARLALRHPRPAHGPDRGVGRARRDAVEACLLGRASWSPSVRDPRRAPPGAFSAVRRGSGKLGRRLPVPSFGIARSIRPARAPRPRARSPSRQAVLPAPIRPPTSASISSRSPLWATARRKSSSPRFASSSAIGSLSSVIGAVVGLGGEAQHRHPTRCARRPTRTAPPGVRNAPPPATPRSPPETTPSSRTLVPEEVAAAAGCGGDGAAGALRLLVAHEDGACDRNALGRKRQAAAWSGRRRPPPAPRLRIRHRAVPCARGDDFPRGRGVPPLPMLYAEIADRRCGRPPTRRIVWHGAEASARPRRQSGSPKVPSPVPPHGGPWGPAFRRPIAFTRSPPHGSGRRRSQPRQAFGRERIRLAREGRDAFDPSHPARGKAWHFDAAPSSGIACWTIALAPALDRRSRADGVPCRRGRVRWSTERAGASASATRPRRGTEPSARDSG
jgi:hypothetical protein